MAKRGGCACEVQTALTDNILVYTEWFCRVFRARGIRRLGFLNAAAVRRIESASAHRSEERFACFRFDIL